MSDLIRFKSDPSPAPSAKRTQRTVLRPITTPAGPNSSHAFQTTRTDPVEVSNRNATENPSAPEKRVIASAGTANADIDQGIATSYGPSWAASPFLNEDYDCIIEPFEIVHVGTALRAVLASMEVERSDFVTKGQLLARLESDAEESRLAITRARADANANIQARKENVTLSTQKHSRAEKMYASSTISIQMLDELRTEAEVARANLLQARDAKQVFELEAQEAVELLERRSIRSPISGVVTERLKAPGEVVNEETILIIAQIDPLAVEVILPAALYGTIRTGMRVEIEPEIPDVGVRVAIVKIVDRVIDPASGTFAARLELPNSDHSLPSGLHCQARFVAPE
jgi:RND family efflux transporter MFP subunit